MIQRDYQDPLGFDVLPFSTFQTRGGENRWTNGGEK